MARNRNQSNYKKNYNKQQRRDIEIADTARKAEKASGKRNSCDTKVSTSNPFSPWYDANNQFTKDAGTLAFGIPLGNVITNDVGDTFAMPGICTLEFIPSVGYSADLTSAINRSAMQFQTYLRSIMKAAADYDAADTMIYMMTMDSAFMFWENMRRAYGVAQLYTPVNKYLPRQLLAVLGFNPNIANDLAKFRAYINKFALSLSRFAVPDKFHITDRHTWMCEGLYVDSDTTRAQLYAFVPAGFWQYDNLAETGSNLKWIAWGGNGASPVMHTLDEIITMGDTLINAIINDSDIADISGDIFRAYKGNLRAVPMTPDMFQVLPLYDKTVLSQIENATIMGWPDAASLTITQNPSVNNGAILFKPTWTSVYLAENVYGFGMKQACDRFLNLHVDSPTPADVIEATRLVTTSSVSLPLTAAASTVTFDVLPSDIVVCERIATFNQATGGFQTLYVPRADSVIVTGTTGDDTSANVASTYLENLAVLEAFDWHTLFFVGKATSPAAGKFVDYRFLAGDIDNVTLCSATQLRDMHDAVLYSLFDVPQVANLS